MKKWGKSLIQSFRFFLNCTILLTRLVCIKIIGCNSLPPQMKKSCLSRWRCGSFVWIEDRTSNDTVQVKMQLDLIKKNTEASWMLTGVWPREYSWRHAQLHCKVLLYFRKFQKTASLSSGGVFSVSFILRLCFFWLWEGTLTWNYLNSISLYFKIWLSWMLLYRKKKQL